MHNEMAININNGGVVDSNSNRFKGMQGSYEWKGHPLHDNLNMGVRQRLQYLHYPNLQIKYYSHRNKNYGGLWGNRKMQLNLESFSTGQLSIELVKRGQLKNNNRGG